MPSILIAGFPGVGKTYFKDKNRGSVVDALHSHFSWTEKDGFKVVHPKFPSNYIQHIKQEEIAGSTIILISSHTALRKALEAENMAYTIFYPNINLKDEYIERYKKLTDNHFMIRSFQK